VTELGDSKVKWLLEENEGAPESVARSRMYRLFMLMLLFRAVFFIARYVMGRNEYDGSVRAGRFFPKPEISVSPKTDVVEADEPSRSCHYSDGHGRRREFGLEFYHGGQ